MIDDGETVVATTYEVGKSVLLTRIAPRVIVDSAPARSQIRLDVLQQSDSSLLWISGSALHFGNDRQRREVIYRVTGWDPLSCTLLIERESPADESDDHEG